MHHDRVAVGPGVGEEVDVLEPPVVVLDADAARREHLVLVRGDPLAELLDGDGGGLGRGAELRLALGQRLSQLPV